MENGRQLCTLPCCYKENSSVQFCLRCIDYLCSQSTIGVGCCPNCRSFIENDSGVIRIKKNVGKCSVCEQAQLMAHHNMCEGCLNHRNIFSFMRYECEECCGLQRIPFPMWRYQLTTSFFTRRAKWLCCSCGKYTAWRLLPQDVHLVPVQDRPLTWNSPANKFYENIVDIDEAKTRHKGRFSGLWKCFLLSAIVSAVLVIDLKSSNILVTDR